MWFGLLSNIFIWELPFTSRNAGTATVCTYLLRLYYYFQSKIMRCPRLSVRVLQFGFFAPLPFLRKKLGTSWSGRIETSFFRRQATFESLYRPANICIYNQLFPLLCLVWSHGQHLPLQPFLHNISFQQLHKRNHQLEIQERLRPRQARELQYDLLVYDDEQYYHLDHLGRLH